MKTHIISDITSAIPVMDADVGAIVVSIDDSVSAWAGQMARILEDIQDKDVRDRAFEHLSRI